MLSPYLNAEAAASSEAAASATTPVRRESRIVGTGRPVRSGRSGWSQCTWTCGRFGFCLTPKQDWRGWSSFRQLPPRPPPASASIPPRRQGQDTTTSRGVFWPFKLDWGRPDKMQSDPSIDSRDFPGLPRRSRLVPRLSVGANNPTRAREGLRADQQAKVSVSVRSAAHATILQPSPLNGKPVRG
jgi:hypothetical protein